MISETPRLFTFNSNERRERMFAYLTSLGLVCKRMSVKGVLALAVSTGSSNPQPAKKRRKKDEDTDK
jgi:hypothetical protein